MPATEAITIGRTSSPKSGNTKAIEIKIEPSEPVNIPINDETISIASQGSLGFVPANNRTRLSLQITVGKPILIGRYLPTTKL